MLTILQKLKSLFQGAADRAMDLRQPLSATPFTMENTVVNYVWVNDISYEKALPVMPMCSVPLNAVDIALANAARYPDTKFIFWADYKRMDQPSRVLLQSHVYFSGTPNFEMRDLRDIKRYVQADRDLGYKGSRFARPDLARLFVMQDCFQNTEYENVLYCDLDVDDVRIGCKQTEDLLQRSGLALSMTATLHSDEKIIGLGYIALQRGEGETFLGKRLIPAAYRHIIEDDMGSIQFALEEALFLRLFPKPVHPEILLRPIRYQIPENPNYTAWGINPGQGPRYLSVELSYWTPSSPDAAESLSPSGPDPSPPAS